ncbi:MAG: hypothetical protein ACXVEF_17875 [Polyangiales bacterium]
MTQRQRLAIGSTIMLAAIGLFVVRSRRGTHGGATPAAGGEYNTGGVEYKMTPITAGLKAPAGNTPCETAYNGLEAYDHATQEQGGAPWGTLVSRDVFIARCAKLPELEQQCLQPRYPGDHPGVCDKILEKYDGKNALFKP